MAPIGLKAVVGESKNMLLTRLVFAVCVCSRVFLWSPVRLSDYMMVMMMMKAVLWMLNRILW